MKLDGATRDGTDEAAALSAPRSRCHLGHGYIEPLLLLLLLLVDTGQVACVAM